MCALHAQIDFTPAIYKAGLHPSTPLRKQKTCLRHASIGRVASNTTTCLPLHIQVTFRHRPTSDWPDSFRCPGDSVRPIIFFTLCKDSAESGFGDEYAFELR